MKIPNSDQNSLLVVAGGYDERVIENIEHHLELVNLANKLQIILARVLLRRSLFLISGGWLLIGGCWLFISSSWLLIGSCRLLIGGCWLLISSFWLLISSGRLLVCRLFYRLAVGICLCLLSVYFCIDLFLDRINLAF